MEPPFDKLDGVISTTSGYTGGSKADPTYSEVSSGGTGHAEAVQVVYDPAKVSYEQLLDVFWHNVDPLDGGGQFCDRGDQYRTAIFAESAEQRRLAEASKQALADSGRFSSRSSPRSSTRAPSTRPRTTTRTTTRRTRSGTSSTAGTAAATSAWPSSGARRRPTEPVFADPGRRARAAAG